MRKFIGKWIPTDIAYYMHLDNPDVIKALQYRFKGLAIIYGIRCQYNGIRCQYNGMMYIGSTLSPALRFHKHLNTGERSNEALQADIVKYGLGKFTVHVFKEVTFPPNTSYSDKKALLFKEEQHYLDLIPAKRRYNAINVSSTGSK